MSDRPFNVLFLCTGNSARSVLAEGILHKDGAGRFNVFSASSHPKGKVNPFALKVLEAYGYPADGYRSKSWDEFARPGAPVMDFVFTVCDGLPIRSLDRMTLSAKLREIGRLDGATLSKTSTP